MHLSIYSLKRTLFSGEASGINCKTQSGEITILDHHIPLISILAEGTMKIITPAEKEEYFPIKGGLLEVKSDNEVRLIVEEN